VAVHLLHSPGGVVGLLEVDEAEPAALAAAVAHDDGAGDGPEAAERGPQHLLVRLWAQISHVDVAELARLHRAVLRGGVAVGVRGVSELRDTLLAGGKGKGGGGSLQGCAIENSMQLQILKPPLANREPDINFLGKSCCLSVSPKQAWLQRPFHLVPY